MLFPGASTSQHDSNGIVILELSFRAGARAEERYSAEIVMMFIKPVAGPGGVVRERT